MKISRSFIFFLIVFFLNSCSKNNNKQERSLNININSNLKVKFIKLSEVFDSVSIIKLQTLPECLIGEISSLLIHKEKIYVLDKMKESIWIFSLQGDFINKICNIGKGPGEYIGINDFFIDNSENRIILIASNKIQLYSLKDLKVVKEISKKIFGIQYWYIGNNYFAYFRNNMVSDNLSYNLIISKGDKIDRKYFPIENNLEGLNFSPPNNFSLKNDKYLTLFSLPFTNIIYKIENNNLTRFCNIIYDRKSLDRKRILNYSKTEFTEQIVKSGLFYGNEDHFFDERFIYFKFRGDRNTYLYFAKKDKLNKFSNVIIDDIVQLPFQGFIFGSIESNFLVSYSNVYDIENLNNELNKLNKSTKDSIIQILPNKISNLLLNNIDKNQNPILICYHY